MADPTLSPSSSRTLRVAVGVALSLAACRDRGGDGDEGVGAGEVPSASAHDERVLIVAPTPPPPIVGASLTVLDESTVVVTDPDRDLVHIVGVAQESTVVLAPGAQPWRAVADDQGRVHVVLRGSGSVATIDVEAAVLIATRAVCPTVRGVALRPQAAERDQGTSSDTLVFACAGGEVVSLPADPARSGRELVATLDADLRDVMVGPDGSLSVTRFRSGEVLRLHDDGTVASRVAPPPWLHLAFDGAGSTMRTSTAWRTVGLPDGGWIMAHQGGSDVVIDPEQDDGGDEGASATGGEAYGGGHSDTCGSVVQGVLTLARGDGQQRSSGALMGAVLPVDLAMHPSGEAVAIAIAGTCAGAFECFLPHVLEVPLETLSVGVGVQPRPCNGGNPILSLEAEAQIVAVAYTPAGRLWALQREPSIVHLLDGGDLQSVRLSDVSVEDTGHRLFHEIGRAGVACASCHAEGGDDGLVWNLPGPRHTPALDVGLAGTAPFHWNGELEDFAALVHEVHEGRMGELLQSQPRIDAFESWVTQLRATPPRAMDGAAQAGRVLFTELGCTGCHGGASTTSNQTVAVGPLPPLQVPSLRGVALHPPYMHDGRSPTLTAAVREMLAQTRPGAAVDEAALAELVAYLETL